MALSASLIARCAIALSQEVTGPVLPEASTALKAITSQSVMALARAEVGKAAPHAMTNRNSAAIARMDRRFEPEFIIPPIQCLFAQATVPNIHTCQATFIPCRHSLFVVCHLSFIVCHCSESDLSINQ